MSQRNDPTAEQLISALVDLYTSARDSGHAHVAGQLEYIVVGGEVRIPNEHEIRGYLTGVIEGGALTSRPTPTLEKVVRGPSRFSFLPVFRKKDSR